MKHTKEEALAAAPDTDREDLEHARERLTDALDMLKRLADASEAALSTEPDMPTYESTMDDFEYALDQARDLLKREAEEP
jgi:soluble cytochrome b562